MIFWLHRRMMTNDGNTVGRDDGDGFSTLPFRTKTHQYNDPVTKILPLSTS